MHHLRHDLGSDRPFILVANKIDLVRNRKVSPEGKCISLWYLVVKIETRRRYKDVINRRGLIMPDNHAQLLKNRDGSETNPLEMIFQIKPCLLRYSLITPTSVLTQRGVCNHTEPQCPKGSHNTAYTYRSLIWFYLCVWNKSRIVFWKITFVMGLLLVLTFPYQFDLLKC